MMFGVKRGFFGVWLLVCLGWWCALSVQAKPLTDQPVYLYRSPLTAQFFKLNEADYEDLLGHWRIYLRRYGKAFRELNRSQLIEDLEPGVLVLGSALLLDDEERRAIEAFVKNGGSLLATWATGVRGSTGQWMGYGFVESMFKVKVRGQIDRGSESWFMTPFGDGPLTWTLPAGRRMFMGKTAENLLRVESENLAAVYMDWDRSRDGEGPNGAIAFHEADSSRAVYFSFPESAWFFHTPADVSLMLDAAMAWLRREPKLFKAAWPNGYVASHLIEMDTEDKFFSAPSFADHLEKIGVKGTFYCLTSVALKYPDVVKNLLERGHEIAYHADVHVGFRATKPQAQEERIKTMKDQMRKIIGDKSRLATGFRAPTESYDPATEVVLRKHGILHHASDPNAHEDRLPFFSKAEPQLSSEQALVVLPRTQYDDVSFRRLNFSATNVDESLAHDLDLIEKGGAFGLLSVHTQNYVEGGLMLQTMPKYLARVAALKDRVWVTRGDEIAEWWRQRERVDVRHSVNGNDHLLQISVKKPGAVQGLAVFVTHPARNAAPSVVSREDGGRPVKTRIKSIDPFRSAIIFDKLDAGDFQFGVNFQ